jgi:predicted nucleic acid-binding protein
LRVVAATVLAAVREAAGRLGPFARRSALLHVPDPRPVRDALIAATALVHGMSVVTRNVADFVSTGTKIIDPWEAGGQPS